MKNSHLKQIAFAALAFSALAVSARPVVICGDLLDTETSGGVYEIMQDGTTTILTNPAYATSYAASGGGCYYNNRYYMSKIWMSGYSSQTYTFNTENVPWTTVDTDGNGSSTVLSTDYSYDGETNKIYGFMKQAGNNYVIGIITPGSSWSRRVVQVQQGPDMVDVKIDCTDPENKWHGIAFDAQNQLWVLTFGGALNQVDKTTGAMTLVGQTGIKPTENGSAAFDMLTGKLYWAVKNAEGSAVYEVNTTTAEATKVMDVPGNKQLMGIYIPAPIAEDGAPAAATNLHFELNGGSLSGNFVFDIPGFTFNDEPATGEVNYTVTIGNADPVTGTSTFGAQNVSIPFTADIPGDLSASVVLSNSVGNSPTAKYEGFVGYGMPTPPANVALSYEDGNMVLAWDPVTTTVNDRGYLGEIIYVVSRTLNGVTEVVAPALTTTSFSEAVAEPETGFITYTYSIVADNGGRVSNAANSPAVSLGSLALPYENNFTTKEDFEAFASFNVNPSSKTWAWNQSNGNVTLSWDRAYTKDDWLITPPVKVQQGYQYTVSIQARSSSTTYKEQVALAWGSERTPEGMTNIINDGSLMLPNEMTTVSGNFIAPETATIYIGIQACSAEDQMTLTIDDFSISDGENTFVKALVGNGMGINVIAKRNAIRLQGEGEVQICSVDGMAQTILVEGAKEVSLVPGIYIVRTAGETRKVVVK